MKKILFASLLLAASCATTPMPLTDAAKRLKVILMTNDKAVTE